ncbi:hypothetical protein [Sulfitobacter sp. 1A12126]|uniref:hypothetical protein n=1 Tax=Sulfitobacter sp. 1A12126 TaxID=3368591 RepID=UPI0037482FD2
MKLEFSAKVTLLGKECNRMKASKFTEAQKAFILKQSEQGTPVAEVRIAILNGYTALGIPVTKGVE